MAFALLGSLASGQVDDLSGEIGGDLLQLGPPDMGLVDSNVDAVGGHDGEARALRSLAHMTSLTHV
jgi:hypothetical protein